MRRILGIAGLMAGLMVATAVPAAAQGWGYAAYDEPWGAGVGVRVGGVGVGIGAPAYGTYAADYGYASPQGYAYPAAPCGCGTAANYSRSYVRSYRPSYAAESSYAYDPGYAYSYFYSSQPAYGYESTYAYGDRVGYGGRGPRIMARGEIREGVRTRDTVRSASVTDERNAVRATSRDQTVGLRERNGTARVRADSGITMRGGNDTTRAPSTDGRGGNIGAGPQAGGELRTGTTGRGGAPSRMIDQGGAERR